MSSSWTTPSALSADVLANVGEFDVRPLRIVDLDHEPWTPRAISNVRAAASAGPPIVGVTGKDVPTAVLEALDFTLGPADCADRGVVAPELFGSTIDADLRRIESRLAGRTQTATVTREVLTATASASTTTGLAIESHAYSLLQAGAEFASWLASNDAVPSPAVGNEVLALERAGRLVIVLNRPGRRNAMNAALRRALLDALVAAEARPDLMIELRGSGEHFSAGGDLAEFGTFTDPVSAHLLRIAWSSGAVLDRLSERTTAVIGGAAIGAGMELAAFAGRVVATPDAFFGLPELGLGLIPGAGGTVSVPRRIGRWRTCYMLYTGCFVPAQVAHAWGLVDEITAGGPDAAGASTS